jgi:YD repeat-containing protein
MTGQQRPEGQAGRVSVGHPVDVASGNLYHDFEDFVLSGRIVGATLPGGVEERFRYDATDNQVATTRPDEEGIPWETGCAYGPGNVLKSMGLVRYEHDRLGQLVRKIDTGQVTRYTWNRSGQLTGVELPGGSVWTYGYDAFGRRVYKEGPSGRVEFVWDGDVVLHEIRTDKVSEGESDDGSGEGCDAPAPEVVHWEFDPVGFAPICKVERGEQYLCVNDVAGNPRELVRRDGLPVWRASYSAWGEVTVAEGAWVACPVR